jgi:aspartate aminotransferase-like enzyme
MAREAEPLVMKAKPASASDPVSVWSPPDLGEVIVKIQTERPQVVFAPHVETSTGIILPKSYIQAIGKACREVVSLDSAYKVALNYPRVLY